MYYSERNNFQPMTYNITDRFLGSLSAYLTILIEELYFYEKYNWFNEQNDCNQLDNFKFEKQMLFELGFTISITGWDMSFNQKKFWSNDEVLDVIEFIFKHISLPSEWESAPFGEATPTAYDKSDARYKYTCGINALFSRSKLGYRIKNGVIQRVYSDVLDERLKPEEFEADDDLRREAIQAVKLFKSRSSADKITALTTIANAFELAKTLKYPDDKKESINSIIKSISEDNIKLEQIMNQHFICLTEISNKAKIRHKEKGTIDIKDSDLQNYLFYTYYNAIDLITKQLDSTIVSEPLPF